MASFELTIYEDKLKQLVDTSPETGALLQSHVVATVDAANAMSAGFRTGIYHREDGTTVGNTQPRYAGDTQKSRGCYIGLVHPDNYAAMKDNHERNTMLKALR